MINNVAQQLNRIKDEIDSLSQGRPKPTLIAVSKNFDAHHIMPALEQGQRHFGENRVQESQRKWPALKAVYPDVILHLIGPLQSNKVAEAVALFDVIHSVDREKIARALADEMERQKRPLDVFIQINTGNEPQKAGILPVEADDFIVRCQQIYRLTVKGLMCIPPVNQDPVPHFKLLADMAHRHGLCDLSMGMSGDYPQAIKAGASFIRVGSALFGSRS